MRIFEGLVQNIRRKQEIRRAKRDITNHYCGITDYDISTGEYLARREISLAHAIKRCDIAIAMGRDAQQEVLGTYDIKGLGLEAEFSILEKMIEYIDGEKGVFSNAYGQDKQDKKEL